MKLVLISFFTVLLSNPSAYSSDLLDIKSKYIFAGLQLGKSTLTTSKSDEAGDKEGLQYGVMTSGLFNFERFSFNLGISYYFLNFESDRVDNVKYDLETKTLAIDGSPLWSLYPNFTFGPKLQLVLTEKILVGPSDKKNESSDDLTTNFVVGLNGFYTHEWNKFNLRYGVHLHKPYSIGNRDATILLLSIEIGQLFTKL
jgi:hypothetical protein